jgi:DNA replication ATP-dependent helicase Dna2
MDDVNGHEVSGVVSRILLEPRRAKRGGYLFRSLEIVGRGASARSFINIPRNLYEQGRGDLYRFPELCRPGVEICGRGMNLNNTLTDGTRLYVACPSSWLTLEPRRFVNVTEAAQAAICIRRADIAARTPMLEPFWSARGALIHALLSALVVGACEGREPDFDASFASALRSVSPKLIGSGVSFDERTLRDDVEGHFRRIGSWLRNVGPRFRDVSLELEVRSTLWGLRGRVDALFRNDEESLILELKTGRDSSNEHPLQLAGYALALQGPDGRLPKGTLLYSRSGRAESLENPDIAALIEGRNRILALRRRYATPRDGASPTPRGTEAVCADPRNCFQRHECRLIFGEDRVALPFANHPHGDYYESWFHAVSQDMFDSEESSSNQRGLFLEAAESNGLIACDVAGVEPGAGMGTRMLWLTSEDLFRFAAIMDRVRLYRPGEEFGRQWTGLIRDVAGDSIRVEVGVPLPLGRGEPPYSAADSIFQEGNRLHLEPLPFSGGSAARHALFFFITRGAPSVVEAITREGPGHDSSERTRPDRASERGPDDRGGGFDLGVGAELNEDQFTALHIALSGPPVHLIHGPPGTGKTRLLARIVRKCLDRGERTLLCAPTHTALDVLLVATLRLGLTDFLRLGPKARASQSLKALIAERNHRSCFAEDLWDASRTASEFLERARRVPLVAAVAHACASHPFFLRQAFDLAVIDEAGQLSEPFSVGAAARACRVVLGGDHLQLPPIVRNPATGRQAGPNLERSLFERLALSGNIPFSRLRVQYRMNREIQDIPSGLFYGGELEPAPEVARRRLPTRSPLRGDRFIDRIIQGEPPVVFVDVGSDQGEASYETREATLVEELARAFLVAGVPASEIGVITPYRAQQAAVRNRLRMTGPETAASVAVDTVERFQGGEREVIIFSPAPTKGVTSFLADSRRLNVALTRAKSKLILLGDAALLETDSLFRAILERIPRVTATRSAC